MIKSLGQQLDPRDFLRITLGNQHAFVIIQNSDLSRPLIVTWPVLLSIIKANVEGGTGTSFSVNDDGIVIQNDPAFLNFTGTGVTVTQSSTGVEINIPGGGSSFITSISDTADIDLTVTSSTLSAALTNTTVTPGLYGTSTTVPQITVDSKGRVTGVTNVAIASSTGTVTIVDTTDGTGIQTSITNASTTPNITITNTAPDQTVGLTGGNSIDVSGAYPNFTIRTNVTASQRLLGRYSTGAGVSEEIVLGAGFSFSGSTLNFSGGGPGAVTSVSGTASRISASPTTGAVVVDIDANYVGQATITTLGTIGTGTWQGTGIGTTYGGTGLTSIGSALQYLRVNSGGSGLEYASLPLTAKGDLFTRNNTADAALALGLNTQVLTVDTSTATGLKWGTNTAPTPLGYYGAFSDVTDQFATVINTGYPMRLGVTDLTNGVTVVSNSRVTIANTGIYNIQWSAQFRNPTAADHDVTIWLRKNGVDVPSSAGVVLVPRKHGSFDGHVLPSWNFLLDPIAGDYYEFVWSTEDIAVIISHEPVGSYAPSTASVVLTVTQQSGIMAGTGMTSLTTLGTSGAASYNNLTGVLNVPIYGGGGGITELTGDVTTPAASSGVTAATLAASYTKGSSGVIFDGAGGVIATNTIGYVQIPYNGTITGWTLVSSVLGSCTITAFKDTYGAFPPVTTADDIFVTPPAISGAIKAQNLSAPTNSPRQTVTAGDWIGFKITGVTTVTWVNLTLSITKTV